MHSANSMFNLSSQTKSSLASRKCCRWARSQEALRAGPGASSLSFRPGSLGTLKLKHLGIRKDCECQSNTPITPRATGSCTTRPDWSDGRKPRHHRHSPSDDRRSNIATQPCFATCRRGYCTNVITQRLIATIGSHWKSYRSSTTK